MWPFSKKKAAAAPFDQILALASLESSKLGHNYVGSEHVLCALVQIPDPRLRRLFRRCVIGIEVVRDAIIDFEETGPCYSTEIVRPQTPRLKRILQLAEATAARLANLTPPQSLLLAILLEEPGVAIRALKSLDIDLEMLRAELETPSAEMKEEPGTRSNPC